MQEKTKALLICLAFFLGFLLFGFSNYFQYREVNGTSDFAFHWGKINDLSQHPTYPSFYHSVFQVFKESKLFFYTANLVLICLIIPLILFCALKSYWATIIYFTAISLPHIWIYGATYPQAFAFLFLIIYLTKRKNPYVFLVCATLASLIHREGLELFALVFIAEIIDYCASFAYKKWFKGYPNHFKLPTKRLYLANSAFILPTQTIRGSWQIITFAILHSSVILWFYSKKIVTKPFWLILAIAPLAWLENDPRVISVTEIALLFVATPEIVKSKHKKTILLFLTIQLIYFILEFGLGTTKIIQKGSGL